MKIIAVVVLLWALFLPSPGFAQSSSSSQQQIESHARQAAEYLRENKPDLAVPEFKAIVDLDPTNLDAQANLGVLLFFEGKYEQAIPQLRAALKLQPDLPKIQSLLGIAEKRTGDLTAARNDLEEAFSKLGDQKIRVETGMELVELYSATADLDKAAATLSVLRGIEPTDPVLLYTAYRVYSDMAAESLLTLSIVAPSSARMRQAIAHELAKQGKTAEAIENYRAAVKLDPNLPGLHFELADMLNTSSAPADQAEAESEYKKALEVNPLDEQAEARLGEIALRKNNLKGAYDRYTRAVELRPNDPDANIGLAKVLMSMNEPQKAEPLLEHAIQLDPTSAVAHFRLSTVYREMGRAADAKQEIEEYQKYKEMKDKLRDIYQAMRLEPAGQERGETDPRQ
ncbi:MAG TPA: tetratricopeptide repeat protein [Candidatus Cybelea sp.]|nr:tetratricopeptide repeat protein [Candidatus Cybelea sp.]